MRDPARPYLELDSIIVGMAENRQQLHVELRYHATRICHTLKEMTGLVSLFIMRDGIYYFQSGRRKHYESVQIKYFTKRLGNIKLHYGPGYLMDLTASSEELIPEERGVRVGRV